MTPTPKQEGAMTYEEWASTYADEISDPTARRAAWDAAQPSQAQAAEAVADRTPPFVNCRFQECDLPGQCRGEGKCHHPTVSSPASPVASHNEREGLTEEQIEQIACAHGTGGWQSLDDMKRFARALLAARTGEDA